MAITQTITALPTPVPSRTTQTEDEFVSAMDARLAAEPGLVTEVNTWSGQANTLATTANADAAAAAASAVASAASAAESAADRYRGSSATSLLIAGSGSKVFTVAGTVRSWGAGINLKAASAANPANYMIGEVASYSHPTLTLTIASSGGAGTLADWDISAWVSGGIASLLEDSTPELGGDLDANANKITSLGAATAAGDAANLEQIHASVYYY